MKIHLAPLVGHHAVLSMIVFLTLSIAASLPVQGQQTCQSGGYTLSGNLKVNGNIESTGSIQATNFKGQQPGGSACTRIGKVQAPSWGSPASGSFPVPECVTSGRLTHVFIRVPPGIHGAAHSVAEIVASPADPPGWWFGWGRGFTANYFTEYSHEIGGAFKDNIGGLILAAGNPNAGKMCDLFDDYPPAGGGYSGSPEFYLTSYAPSANCELWVCC